MANTWVFLNPFTGQYTNQQRYRGGFDDTRRAQFQSQPNLSGAKSMSSLDAIHNRQNHQQRNNGYQGRPRPQQLQLHPQSQQQQQQPIPPRFRNGPNRNRQSQHNQQQPQQAQQQLYSPQEEMPPRRQRNGSVSGEQPIFWPPMPIPKGDGGNWVRGRVIRGESKCFV